MFIKPTAQLKAASSQNNFISALAVSELAASETEIGGGERLQLSP
jgi:hypothetical protein